MKKCQFCSKPAALHLTRIINKQKLEMVLCEACAREQNLIGDAPQELAVPAIVQFVLGASASPVRPTTEDAVCPACGAPYAHFRAQGRLGCPHEYEVFRSLLEPLLEKVHSTAGRHVGKIPRRHRRRIQQARRVELEAQLKTAVAAEKYEEAARLRDSIRALGADHEP
jgi:protein arginine kinase activator